MKQDLHFRTIHTDTITGIEESEWYKANGWKIATVGFNTITFTKPNAIKQLKVNQANGFDDDSE